jgi:hypothetical protein
VQSRKPLPKRRVRGVRGRELDGGRLRTELLLGALQGRGLLAIRTAFRPVLRRRRGRVSAGHSWELAERAAARRAAKRGA